MKYKPIKTVFFNYYKVIDFCKKDPYKVLDFFSTLYKKPMPTNLVGTSFILDVASLMRSPYYDSEKLDYINLAAIRNFFDYEYQNNAGLWLPYTNIDIVKINSNRLLQIKDNYIYFKFEEEYTNGTKV